MVGGLGAGAMAYKLLSDMAASNQEKKPHPNAHDIAAILTDTSRGDDLPAINSLAALMAHLGRGTRAEITAIIGLEGSAAGQIMAPLIARRFVQFRRIKEEGQPLWTGYVVNNDVVDYLKAVPEMYPAFTENLEQWQQQLPPANESS